MKLVERDTGGLDLTPVSPRDPSPCHVGNIIRSILNELIIPGQRRPYDELSEQEQRRLGNYAAGGWAWEQIIRDGLVRAGVLARSRGGGNIISTGELDCDGIFGNPDGFDIDAWSVVEFKATWRSSRRPLDPDFWHWLAQIQAYCKLCGTRRAILHVFYVNGDYRDSGPQYKVFDLTFGQIEIVENWEMLITHARGKNWLPNKRQR